MKMRGKRALNYKFKRNNGAVTVSCACIECRGIRAASRASEKHEAEMEIADQLASGQAGEPCEDCGQCDGWACKGDATYTPLPAQGYDPDECFTCGHSDSHVYGGLGICGHIPCGCDGPTRQPEHAENTEQTRQPVTCDNCGTVLEPVFDPDSPYQFRDALWLGFHGGYAMFVDNLDVSEVWGDPSLRVLPGGPDYEAVICGTCAEALLTANPWMERLFLRDTE